MIHDSHLPNPLIIILVFALGLALVRVITTIIHEMGHTIAALFLLKGNFDVYIGSYGNNDQGLHFKIGRLRVHFIYKPFLLEEGLFVPDKNYPTTYLRNFIIVLAGPLLSFIFAGIYAYLAIFTNFPDIVKIVFYILAASSFLDFWHNIKPHDEPIQLSNGKFTYNDGYQLRQDWIMLFYTKHIARLHALYNKKLYKQGVNYFERIYRNNRQPDLLRMGIVLYYKAKENGKGKQLMDFLVSITEPDDNDYNVAALYYKAEGDFEKVLEYYRRSLELNSNNAHVYNNRGYTYNLLNRFEEAMADLHRAIELDPESAFAHNNRGFAKIKLGMPEEGLKDIQKSLQLDSENAYAYRNLGIYHAAKAEYKQAMELFRKAKTMDADTEDIDRLIGETENNI